MDLLVASLALVGGYLAGSLPLSAMIGRAAGVDVVHGGEGRPGSATVWQLAGPGWGLLALAGDLARGVLPVAIATTTWSWPAGWAAGLGALLGACWPLFGRLPGGHGVAVLAGVAFALAPAAGTASTLLALMAVGATRLLGRGGRVAAIRVGFGSFPLLFLAEQADLARLAALLVLYLVVALRYVVTRR